MALALAPYLALLALVLAAAMAWPVSTHWLRDAPEAAASGQAPMDPEAVDRLMREMAPPPDPADGVPATESP